MVLGKENIVRAAPIHGHRSRETDGGHSWNGRELVHNLLVHAYDAFGLIVWYLRFRNVKAECLHGIRGDETRIHMHQGVKGADHEPGADEQDQGKRDLHHNQGLTGAMPFTALAKRTATLAETAVG